MMNKMQQKIAERVLLFHAGHRIFWSMGGRRPKLIMGFSPSLEEVLKKGELDITWR